MGLEEELISQIDQKLFQLKYRKISAARSRQLQDELAAVKREYKRRVIERQPGIGTTVAQARWLRHNAMIVLIKWMEDLAWQLYRTSLECLQIQGTPKDSQFPLAIYHQIVIPKINHLKKSIPKTLANPAWYFEPGESLRPDLLQGLEDATAQLLSDMLLQAELDSRQSLQEIGSSGGQGQIAPNKLSININRSKTEKDKSLDSKSLPNQEPQNPENKSKTRRELVDDYIEEVFQKTKRRITRTIIWQSVGYKNRTEFEKWQRNDPKKVNKTADERFTRLLREKPHLK